MPTAKRSAIRTWIGSVLLLGVVLGTGACLAAWKTDALQAQENLARSQPEPVQSITAATAVERDYRETTSAIGTVVALRSITLHNELAGTVRRAALTPGAIVEAGTVLVALDVSVETAELQAQQAQVALTESLLARLIRASERNAAPAADVDRARAERDIALAQVARTQAVIARKTVVAPFRARVGMADIHEGQYLREGTRLTTLQGIDDGVHVDFAVTQDVAAGLRPEEPLQVVVDGGHALTARVVAIDARVDPTTRNATVRARIDHTPEAPAPGSAVRVQVPVGAPTTVVTVPVSALRRGPDGSHVAVLVTDDHGKERVHLRPVRSGAVLGDEVAVLDGLAVGERVAAAGSFKLYESALVAVAADRVATTAAAAGN